MDDLLQFALIGLGTGAIYALAAQGLVLVYRGSGILNFASGAMGMIGAQLFYQLKDQDGVDYKLALIVGLGVPALIGLAMELGVMRWLRDATGLAKLIATLGLFTGLIGLGLELFGSKFRIAVSLLPQDTVRPIGDTAIGVDRLWLLALAAILTLVLTLVYRYTKFGLATSAVAENQRATAALGRSPDMIAAINWFLGGLLAGLAAIMLAPIAGGPGLLVVDLSLLVIPALAAALVGGFTSFAWTFFGAVFIGVLESELAYLSSQDDLPDVFRTPGIARAVPFLVIIGVLVIRGRALPVRGEESAKPPDLGTGRVRIVPLVLTIAGVLALVWGVLNESWINALMVSGIVAIVCLSLVVLTGYAGQLSLAQFTLAGVAAWMGARLADTQGISFGVALLIGMVGVIPIGLAVALPALRTRGVNLAVATLGMALALEHLVLRNGKLTLTNDIENTTIDPPTLFGIDLDRVRYPERYATLIIVFLVIAMLLVANLRRGRAGRRMIAVRTNERAAASLGISVFGAKLFAFAIASAIAGMAGVLFAFRSHTVLFDQSYGVDDSINAVVYAVIGGIGYVVGPIFGSFFALGGIGGKFFEILGDWIGVDLENIFQAIGGFMLITILLQDPNGLASNYIRQMRAIGRRLPARLRSEPPEPAPLPEVTRERVPPKALSLRELTVSFGGVQALTSATLEVHPGEVLGLIGPNGAGKTTLIDAATGFVKPRHGQVTLGGTDLGSLNPRRRARLGLARSFQSLELFEDMTVRDNLRTASDRRDTLAYLTDLFRPGDPPLSAAAVAAVREFGLEPDLDRRPGELPHGRRRLVGIARAVATEPSVLLLDEPAAGLDDDETAELGRLIRRLADDWGLAVLLIEHDVGLVLSTCDRVVALDFGLTIAVGTPEEIRHHPAVVEAYLGDTQDGPDQRESASAPITTLDTTPAPDDPS